MDGTKLTVFFEGPFWVGVFDRVEGGSLSACKITFGAEPRDCEVWDFILRHYSELSFSSPVPAEEKQRADSPRRRQRSAKKQMQGAGTKSQQALALQREARKELRRKAGREQKAAEKQRQLDLKRQKRRKKHRGR